MYQPQWLCKAQDLALSVAAAKSASMLWDYGIARLMPDSLQFFEERSHFGPMLNYERLPGFSYRAHKALRTMNTLSCHKQGREIWKALERFGTPPPSFVIGLCAEVSDALTDFEKVAITAKDRKAAGARIRTMALKLAEELANPAVAESLIQVKRRLPPREDSESRRPSLPHAKQLIELAEIATGIKDLPKTLGQPNSTNAKRLYFIRRITKWVNQRMGTPMRTQVFALTAAFFDVSDLDPQSLATLAPVSKAEKR